MKNLRDVDLNLLVVFREIVATRQISQAARNLGLSQPAASNALTRLRATFDDALFVRAGHAMQPTRLALQLAGPIGAALALIQESIHKQDAFEPSTSDRHFSLAMTDLAEVHFMPRLIERCARDAPGVRLGVVRSSGTALRDALHDGSIDLAVAPYEDMPEGLFRQLLFRQECVTLFRASHPFAAKPPTTLAEFRAARHLFVSQAVGPYAEIQRRMEQAGVRRSGQDQVSSHLTVPFVVAASDCVVTVPDRLVSQFAGPLGLKWAKPPLRLPTLRTCVFWHRRAHEDLGNRWLRSLIGEMFGDSATARAAR